MQSYETVDRGSFVSSTLYVILIERSHIISNKPPDFAIVALGDIVDLR